MMATANSSGIVIATNGDLLLKADNRRLLVSSEVLFNSSQYFAALLGPHFKEGQVTRSAQRPQCITLADDNGQAVDDMCQLLHGHQPKDLLSKVPIERLLRYAVVVDKYGCSGRLQLQSRALLWSFLDLKEKFVDEKDQWSTQIVAAAYLLHDKRSFTVATYRLTTQTLGYFKTWPPDVSRDVLPQILLDAVDNKRNAASIHLTFELTNYLCDIEGDYCEYDCVIDRRHDVQAIFGGTWPGMRYPIQTTIAKAKQAGRVVSCGHRQGEEEIRRLGGIDRICAEADDECAGVCLPCLRSGREIRDKCTIESHRY